MLKVNVKNATKKETIRDTLRLTVKSMNGDADGDNIKTFDIPEAKLQDYEMVVKSFLKIIDAYMAKSHNQRCDICRNFGAFVNTVLAKDVNEEWFCILDDVIGDLIPGDPTCDYQHAASYQNHKFTWFDSYGVERECKVTFA